MRIEHRFLTSSGSNKDIKKVISILNKYGIKYRYEEDLKAVLASFKYKLEVKLYEDEEHTEALVERIKPFGFLHQVGTIYEKSDIKNAEWFWATAGEYQYPQPENDLGYLNATFDLRQHCRTCGIGKVQNNPFRLKSIPKQPKNQFWGLHWEHDAIFVRSEAKKLLENESIDGISFEKVIIHKSDEIIENFNQLIVTHQLEKGLLPNNLKPVNCKFMNEEDLESPDSMRGLKSDYCGRVKFNFPVRGGLTFDQSIFEGTPEVVKSSEWFGSGAKAFQLTLVSKRIKQLIESNKLKGLKFTPIFH